VTEKPTIGVVIPTYNPGNMLKRVLEPVMASALKPTVLVVDSSSRDSTVAMAQCYGARVHVIPQSEFNHGATRDLGRHMLGTDIALMMTQDIVPVGNDMIERLVAPLVDGGAVVSYARQIPHDGADFLEAFPRYFNYPDKSELRSLEDTKTSGAYTFFCSNSCAAWSNAALDSVGGFGWTLSLEDTLAVARLLRKSYKIAYCADAVVKHSHRFGLLEEYRRYYDVGFVRAQNRDLLMIEGGDEGRGATFASAMLRRLAREQPLLIPKAVMNSAAKWLGYRVGWHSAKLSAARP
jgi:rhamnosyltransferase